MDSIMQMALGNWKILNQTLSNFDEEQVKTMLDMEVLGKRRRNVIERLHQRFTTLRAARERKELLG